MIAELNEQNPSLFKEWYDIVYLIKNIFFDSQQNSAEKICTLVSEIWKHIMFYFGENICKLVVSKK